MCGAGVSGSYLANLLQDHELEVYDGSNQRGCRCGWGSSETLLRAKVEKVGLDLGDYILCKPKWAVLNGIRFRVANGIIIDKRGMLRDLTKNIKVRPHYVTFNEFPKADIIVNATAKPLNPEQICYTIQWKMKILSLPEKTVFLWFSPKRIGYGWIFPLDPHGNCFHVGAGSLYGTMDAIALVKEMLDGYNLYNFHILKTYCGCQKELHFGQNLPIFQDNVVSIGEAVGCVHPLTGEGILPSIRSAELLAESLHEPTFPMNYAFKIEEIIQEYQDSFQALETLKHHRRLGMIQIIQAMTKRMKQRTQPEVTWTAKLKALLKFVL